MNLSILDNIVPLRKRRTIDWRHVGTYSNKEDMMAAKKTEKVSKRKSDSLKTGTKVTYRCNSWKRTRCSYQMYALHSVDGQIYLYEGGHHDHSRTHVSHLLKTQQKNGGLVGDIFKSDTEDHGETSNVLREFAKQAVSAQDEFLTNLIQQATSMSASPGEIPDGFVSQENEGNLSFSDALFLNKLNESTSKEEDGSSSSASGMVATPSEFHLSDGNSVTTLLQIASDNDLAFSFNSRRRAEYCFSSNQRAGRSVVFSDSGNDIRVAQKMGDEEICVESWRKSDWSQFCWAVRGACVHFLKN